MIEAGLEEHECSVCNRVIEEEYFDLSQNKCVLHCEKNSENGWYTLEGEEKNWDDARVDLFWKYIHLELESITDNNVDPDEDAIHKLEYLHVVFPKHQKDYEYDHLRGHISDLATNFYIHFPYQDRSGDAHDVYNTIENLQLKFVDCTFLDTADFRRYSFTKDVFFFNCTFNNKILLGSSFIKRLSFKECDFKNNILYLNQKNFKDKLVIKRCKNIHDIDLKESTFSSKVKIQSCDIKGMANFYNTKFEDLADFYDTEFNGVDFERTDFNGISIFSESRFNNAVDFKYTKFLGKAIFRDAVFRGTLNLRDSIFDDDALFLDITSQKGKVKGVQVKNRETARVIKNFLDNSNNIIEANKFYALEMEEREKELKFKESPFEWLVFRLHGLSSNHSQDWVIALLWIINLTLVYAIPEPINNIYSFPVWLIPMLIGIELFLFKLPILFERIVLFTIACTLFLSSSITLDIFTKTLNPFSKIKADEVTFSILIYKVIIAYLIYQFIVSIRQNTRRK